MDRYMPVTGTEAPLDVLCETAAYRIRTATQLLESFAANENVHSELARVLVASLRDGCDLLNVFGRRLQKRI
ncbi:hypothetical protein [Pseudomonas fluorescens]|uniref:Short-chain dehydrogenase n=1 Tax=Pseudomonas fluorescens TaxID=294 RepID=A0A5E7RC83_PSEFL|nr:hypothetical protein [Pseudomonas fluorescens]VVO37549.1 hypothetical protein PS833_05506 [Pseudomonas fluorescens]VVP68623.1 hypothetical protein PS914_00737 [Pseudomonas fluorescens]